MIREKPASLLRPAISTLALLTAALTCPAHAQAASPRRPFDIVQGDLIQSLKVFSQQADLPVMTFADIRGRTAPRVSGVLSPEHALALLIDGQNLRIQSVAGGYVLKEGPGTRPSSPVRPPLVPPIDIAPNAVEAVTVTGFRAGLAHARDLKRLAIDSRDIVVAEDIAAFPDLNLAESLQRIPGVTISRDAGEGRQIALRGLGPDFTRTQLNGMRC